jgi:hypothetical protein
MVGDCTFTTSQSSVPINVTVGARVPSGVIAMSQIVQPSDVYLAPSGPSHVRASSVKYTIDHRPST